MKLVVINSFGPMGSTVVASIIEKFGFLNLPVRKIGLSDYLMQKRNIDDKYMIDRIKQIMISHNQIREQGGISVINRNSNKNRLIDFEIVKNKIDLIGEKKYNSISEMYFEVKNVYAESTIYKKVLANSDMQIELMTGRDYRYNSKDLYKAYERNFTNIYMIHLHRPFDSWCNSIVSQWFYKQNIFELFHSFRINKLREGFFKYNEFVKQIPGLHLNFDDLFLPYTEKTIVKISELLEQEIPDIDWKNEEYDLYGALIDYTKTFNKFDDEQIFLSKYTREVIRKLYKNKNISFLNNIVTSILYLFDLFRFKVKNILTPIS